MQILKVGLQILSIVVPRHPIYPRHGLRANRPICRPKPKQRDMVQQRSEPRILTLSCHFTHTAQRTRRIGSGTESGMRFAARVPLGSLPFLPHLRSRGLVQRVRRYYGAIRLPTLVHLRRTNLCSLSDPARDQRPGRAVGSPGSRAWRFRTCRGSLTTRGPPTARENAVSDVAFRLLYNVGTPIASFRGSIARPACTPVNASPRPRGTSTHDSGPPWVASPST
jgi:hypothetical protein